jgi:hypothetical protein
MSNRLAIHGKPGTTPHTAGYFPLGITRERTEMARQLQQELRR